ncbi:thiamine diphosphokinase [Treponema parvum]|uniref:Thiamine diphosphokinase n=1 Tax=Treponema parvum TaxID=138851 RepID=A0A975F0L6_9SPIR|nr:thiamine diphosphokinase [Treponema parvum]QTQ11889.1 thiamine diphosphokinase [Treponema parvum]
MHIVVFTGGGFPLPKATENYWKSTSGPDYVVAADSGLCACEAYAEFWKTKYDFSPDVILGDMDSLPSAEKRLKKYSSEQIILHDPYKDYTDTELALEHAHSYAERAGKGSHKFITLIGGNGGRLDHLLGIFDLFATELRPSVWLCGSQAVWFAPGESRFDVSGVSPKNPISIARVNGDSRSGGQINSSGLEWECGCFRDKGMPSISNRISKKNYKEGLPVKLSVIEGTFLFIFPVTALISAVNQGNHPKRR